MRYANGDLFDAPAPPPPRNLPAHRPLAANTRESRPASDKDRTHDAQVLHHVKANGNLGITRNELHEKTGISIQTLSWCIGRLLGHRKIFRRAAPTPTGKTQRFVSRKKCYVVYAELYRSTFEFTDCPPYQERSH
jgi:hypothetical protein